MKSLTLALGAMVAASAAVYLSTGDVSNEVDLVAPRPARQSGDGSAPISTPTVNVESPAQKGSPNNADGRSENDFVASERDRGAGVAKLNLFRALEAPPAAAPSSPVAAQPAPVKPPPPAPTFGFLGSFKERDELQAIVQVGEDIVFVKPSQIVGGFRVDSVDSNALGWTHEPTATKGFLQARTVK